MCCSVTCLKANTKEPERRSQLLLSESGATQPTLSATFVTLIVIVPVLYDLPSIGTIGHSSQNGCCLLCDAHKTRHSLSITLIYTRRDLWLRVEESILERHRRGRGGIVPFLRVQTRAERSLLNLSLRYMILRQFPRQYFTWK